MKRLVFSIALCNKHKQKYIFMHNTILLYKAEKPSVCLSVRLNFWNADNSIVSVSIRTGLARNESCVCKEH